ncbi:uncharacterized protein BJ171DRAFT_517863 [Polychytrium aggregatum]|uniref:uncharacterized protein n=1 Tax=Polychytrium aggregatum TaxID=110093 RepID=UPI0022FDDCDF|nr:uncharacterized protein BJ171DRAFT_517863 [Polychytrium aggregatum]KAI9199533.1 hypothetical protein BJ171DRAFT_517863 [Polychytrium aggregatum]
MVITAFKVVATELSQPSYHNRAITAELSQPSYHSPQQHIPTRGHRLFHNGQSAQALLQPHPARSWIYSHPPSPSFGFVFSLSAPSALSIYPASRLRRGQSPPAVCKHHRSDSPRPSKPSSSLSSASASPSPSMDHFHSHWLGVVGSSDQRAPSASFQDFISSIDVVLRSDPNARLYCHFPALPPYSPLPPDYDQAIQSAPVYGFLPPEPPTAESLPKITWDPTIDSAPSSSETTPSSGQPGSSLAVAAATAMAIPTPNTRPDIPPSVVSASPTARTLRSIRSKISALSLSSLLSIGSESRLASQSEPSLLSSSLRSQASRPNLTALARPESPEGSSRPAAGSSAIALTQARTLRHRISDDLHLLFRGTVSPMIRRQRSSPAMSEAENSYMSLTTAITTLKPSRLILSKKHHIRHVFDADGNVICRVQQGREVGLYELVDNKKAKLAQLEYKITPESTTYLGKVIISSLVRDCWIEKGTITIQKRISSPELKGARYMLSHVDSLEPFFITIAEYKVSRNRYMMLRQVGTATIIGAFKLPFGQNTCEMMVDVDTCHRGSYPTAEMMIALMMLTDLFMIQRTSALTATTFM